MFYFLIIIIKFLLELSISRSSSECSFNDKSYEENQNIVLSNFNSFEELKFNCSKPIRMSALKIKPNRKLILDDSLNMTGLIIYPEQVYWFNFLLRNLNGFKLDSNPFRRIQFYKASFENLIFTLEDVNFEFFYNDSSVNIVCNENLLFEKAWHRNFYSNSYLLYLGTKTIFASETCPLIFRDVKIRIFSILRISSSFIDKNVLQFKSLSSDASVFLNSTVYHADFTFYHSLLSAKLLDKYIFKDLVCLDLRGQIFSIQADLFKSFNRLVFVRFQMQNVKRLFTKKNDWLQYLNFEFQIHSRHMILVIYQPFEKITFYDYPDEDFCYLSSADFPHKNGVLPVLKPNEMSSCSCTEIYLIQKSYRFRKQIDRFIRQSSDSHYYLHQYYLDDDKDETSFSKCVNDSMSQVIESCQFNKKLKLCNMSSFSGKSKTKYFYWYIF